jgi:hypothetical protein
MDEGTRNSILVVFAFVGMVGNIIAFLVTRLELHKQRQDTRDLAKLTSALEHRVHVLATHLDHRIYRLERVRDLSTGLMHVSVALRQGSREFKDKLDVAVKREMTMPELGALILAIDDEHLKELYSQLANIIANPIWPLMWNNMEYNMGEADQLILQQSNCIGRMHLRILELLVKATSV